MFHSMEAPEESNLKGSFIDDQDKEDGYNRKILNRVKNCFEIDLMDADSAVSECTRTSRLNEKRSNVFSALVNGFAAIGRTYIIEDITFSLRSFLCMECKEIMTDPVTLKCGHTCSKKCIMASIKDDFAVCFECQARYHISYLIELKNNVTILALVEKLYNKQLVTYRNKVATMKNPHQKIRDAIKFLNTNYEEDKELDQQARVLHYETPPGFRLEGDLRGKRENLKEAFKDYMTCFTLEPCSEYARTAAIEILHTLVQNPSLQCSSSKPCSVSLDDDDVSLRCHDEKLQNASNDSLYVAEDQSEEEETFEEAYYKALGSDSMRDDLHEMLGGYFDIIKDIRGRNDVSRIAESSIAIEDVECPLCMRVLYDPHTTRCGHTFCKACLWRTFDHQTTCPLCKACLAETLAERNMESNVFLGFAINSLFQKEIIERILLRDKERRLFVNAGVGPDGWIPLFVCTVAFPTVPCLLHVFEPRYRLMMRQIIEAGGRLFGMCTSINDEVSEYGTMLEIRNVKYFDDGRSIVDTIGRNRFQILEKHEKDGYDVAFVRFIIDHEMAESQLLGVKHKSCEIYQMSADWFHQLPDDKAVKIMEHFGNMPPLEINYISTPDGPPWLWWMLAILPIETRLKVLLISLTSLPQRLELFYKILLHFYQESSD